MFRISARRVCSHTNLLFLAGLLWSSSSFVGLAGEPKGAGVAFFETKVAPLLKEHCYSCHSHAGGKMRGGLALDSRSGWEKGGDSGPAVVPGQPDKSLFIQAIRYTHADTKMPPKGKLGDAEIKILTDWVLDGAADPRVLAVKDDLKDWWSLKQLVRPMVPGKIHPIDAFVQAKLREKQLVPAPEADRRTLIRRLTFDLHGLPPTPDEVDDFVASRDPQAYEKLVDRLLASPRYGERWARHWLDANRYGDSDGNEHDGFREHAWRYRDYVIGAINSDTPYDRFLQEQLATDVLFPQEPALTAALGFLAAGPVVLSGTEYQIRDEFVTQVMSTVTSSTVHCARCHNHKFDPISQEDYYALQAIFAGVQRRTVPVDLDPESRAKRLRWTNLKAAVGKGDMSIVANPEAREFIASWEKAVAEEGLRWKTLMPTALNTASGAKFEQRGDGSLFLSKTTAETDVYTLTFLASVGEIRSLRLEVLPDPKLPGGGPGLADDGAFSLSEFEVFFYSAGSDKAKKIGFKSSLADIASKDQPIARVHDGNDATGWNGGSKPGQPHVAVFELGANLKMPAGSHLEIVLKHQQGKKQNLGHFRISATDQSMSPYSMVPPALTAALNVAPAKRSSADWSTLAAYAVPIQCDVEIKRLPLGTNFYVVAGKLSQEGKGSTPGTVNIMKRGEKPAGIATPGALSCVPTLNSRVDKAEANDEGARRVYLARWLTDPNNPLTWRSIVNRTWHHHFGKGIVDTLNDFGHAGSLPSHPELLDWLACEFRDGGKSMKSLHKLIVTSSTYRQAATPNVAAHKVDADNRLLWRMSRNRLDAESFRDTVLAVAGRLDLKMGGPGVLQFEVKPGFNTTKLANYEAVDWNAPGVNRRSVYRFIFRTRPDPFMTALDFPDASQFVPARVFSVTPLQSLVLFNNNFILHHSDQLAQRATEKSSDTPAQVRQAFRLALQREPTAEETADFTSYTQRHGLAAMCRVLLNSNEFLFVE